MLAITSAAVLFCGLGASPVSAQLAVPPMMPAYQPLSDQQLDQLLGPIALYPDPLLAEILPAATLPAQIVLADRYVTSGGDPNEIYDQPWDTSVQALARYPTVLKYLDDNLAWTTEVGEAFLNQQQDVMDSIQRLRLSARNFGNLQSTPQQEVVDDGGDIEILPAEPDVIYVPVYQSVYVYCQSGFGLGFGFGCPMGPWLNCDFDWRWHHLCFWDRNHPRPDNWWRQRPDVRDAWLSRHVPVWQPDNRHGSGLSLANRGDRGRNNPAVHTPPSNNGTIVNMSRPTAVPRPAATPWPAAVPRPAAVRDFGGFQIPNRPAPGISPAYQDTSVGGRGQENPQTFNRPEPVHSEPVHSEPVHSAPVESAPPVSHPAPSYSGGDSGGGGGSHGGGGGGGGSQPRH